MKQRGYLLVSVLVATFLIVAIGVATSQLVVNNYRIAANELYRINAQLAADAGADHAIQQINQDGTWAGTSGEATLLDNGGTKLTYESTVVDDADPLKKFVTVVGRTYQPASSPTANAERRLELELRGVTGGISGEFSVVSGVGGLIMENNSKIVGGKVYVNGRIDLSNSAQIGLTNRPVKVSVAHQSCPNPPDATYPRVCNSGENGQPITILNNAKIYGEVKATNQTNGVGMLSPGLVAGAPEPAPLPSHDRLAQINGVATTQSADDSECNFPFSSTTTWPANLKITGDVSISNGCAVTVEGNVWITGKISLSNSSKLIVKNGLSTPPVIMIDGQDGLATSNNSKLVSNNGTPPIGFRVITYWSTSACSVSTTNPCEVTGNDLFNSRNTETIKLQNGSEGANTEFYARWSAISLQNAGNIGALVGQTVKLSNSSTVTFGATVSEFSNTEPAAWVVKSYKRMFEPLP